MNSIKSISDSLTKEVRYLLLSRHYIPVLLVPLLAVVIGLYMNTVLVKNNYDFYQSTYDAYLLHGADIEKSLGEAASATTNQNEDGSTVTVIDNSLRYAKDQTALSIYVTTPKYVTTQALELVASILLPLVFGTFAAYMATYDNKFKTIKIKAIQNDWTHVLTGKQFAVALGCILTIMLLLIASYVIGLLLYPSVSEAVPVNEFPLPLIPGGNNLGPQFAVSIFISLMYSSLGFLLGVIFKNVTVPALVLVAYHFFVPSLGLYDPKNLAMVLYNQVFMFYGSFKIVEPKDVSILVAIIGMMLVIVFSSVLSFYISTKQSKYAI